MANSVITIRKARPWDAEAIARIYVESWRDTYPAMLPAKLLLSLTIEGQTTRWRNAITMAARESVYVAEDEKQELVGMTSLGRARDSSLGFDGEIYTLYVHPLMTGKGTGRLLLAGGFDALAQRGYENCVIWSHAQNPSRFFYEAMGGKIAAERTMPMMGVAVPETAYGWHSLALADRRRVKGAT